MEKKTITIIGIVLLLTLVLMFVLLFVLLISTLTLYKRKENYPLERTIYCMIIDKNGKKSSIHDTGIDIEDIKDFITVKLLKREVNNGKEIILDTPKELHLGHSRKDLSYIVRVDSNNLNEEDPYFTISVRVDNKKRFPFK